MKKKNNTTSSPKTISSAAADFRLSSVLHHMKKFFLPWLIIAALAAALIVSLNIFLSPEVASVSATVSFNYSGIEEGLAPNRCEFDVDTIKSDKLVTESLQSLGLSTDLTEEVQHSLFFDGIVSSSIVNKAIQYNSIYNGKSSSRWVEDIRDTSYHPTQYKVTFNYSKTGLDGKTAAGLLNRILENYQKYFLEIYGYSEAVSESLLSIDDMGYDYLITLDMYSSSLTSLENYVDRMAADDTVQFRSSATGHSFSDLADALALIRSVDIDTLTAYILNNGIISNKDMMVSYYTYHMENLERGKKNVVERLTSIKKSIDIYQKDTIMIYDSADDNTASVTETSETYDDLINRKIQLQASVADYDRQIAYYKERLEVIDETKGNAAQAENDYVAQRIAALKTKITKLTEDIKTTADEYYETVKFTNAYSIITPAAHSAMGYLMSVVNESMRLIIIIELVLITIYLFLGVWMSIPHTKKNNGSK